MRGYTEEGEAIPNGWRLIVDHKGDRWHVETRHGFSGPTLIGESGVDFSDAWIDQTGGDLRYYVEPAVEPSKPPAIERQRPRLTVIRGGADV